MEWLDAMRGFTMLLVVCSHIELFMVGKPNFSINELFGEFRMPLFFFVSGFVFYKRNFHFGINEINTLLRKKIFVQILSPLVFLLLFCRIKNIDFCHSFLTAAKSGYWFTFVLFEFFLIYFALSVLMDKISLNGYKKDVLWIVIGLILYVATALGHQHIEQNISGLFSIEKLPYILYFILGTRLRKNWHEVEAMFDDKYTVAVLVITFIGLNVFYDTFSQLPLGGVISVIITAISGILLTIVFFRRYADSFSCNNRFGKIMQYVGRRTLDIYLIHYFFMESLIQCGILDFSGTSLSILQFLVCLIICVVVITGCLILSNMLRTSPLLGHYLFGAKS